MMSWSLAQHMLLSRQALQKNLKPKHTFRHFTSTFPLILLGRSFGSKCIHSQASHFTPYLSLPPSCQTRQLQCIKDVVDFGDQVLALVGMHLLILDVRVLLELASYQPLSLDRGLQNKLFDLAIKLLNLTYLIGVRNKGSIRGDKKTALK